MFFMNEAKQEKCQANHRPGWTDKVPNPVEACASACGAQGCFSAGCRNVDCFDEARKIIFVRSRIRDIRGRKWITPIEDESGISLDVGP